MIGLAILALAGCRGADKPTGVSANSRVEVSSDPSGAQIILDSNPTGKVTPDVLYDLSGTHEILVRMDKDGVTYGYRTQAAFKGDSLVKIYGPLTMRCTEVTCSVNFQKYHDLNDLRVSTNPNGALFYYNGTGSGMYYPAGFPNGYAAIGMPAIAMLSGTRPDTLALGPYNLDYLGGRPSPVITKTADKYSMTQTTWILPPTNLIVSSPSTPTVRGIQVDEELLSSTSQSGTAFVKLTFTNITNKASYQAADPIVPSVGLKYDSVYVGLVLDADIGDAADDAVTYEPALDMVYMYDMDFRDGSFTSAWVDKPALVGLRIMSTTAPARILNAWPSSSDPHSGDASERFGWGYLSGHRSQAPDYPGAQIGMTPNVPGDYRMSVSAGPVSLAPGESTSIVVAIIVADPVVNTFQPGNLVFPGDPLDTTRTIRKIAAGLIDRARSLVIP